MLAEAKELFIREKAREHIPEINEKISWSLHAVKKLRVEGLRKRDVEDSIYKPSLERWKNDWKTRKAKE
jgi:hypothetical protein